jgi:hypothetical protein
MLVHAKTYGRVLKETQNVFFEIIMYDEMWVEIKGRNLIIMALCFRQNYGMHLLSFK